MNIAEKHLGIEIVDNVIIRKAEFKLASEKFDQLAQDFNDLIDDDAESLYWKGLALGFDDFYSLTVDTFLDTVLEIIEDYDDEGEHWLKEYVPLLKEYEGFTIMFDVKGDTYGFT